jgi:hypothetical protein
VTTPAICSLCHRPGATLQAGGDVGACHPECFEVFDRLAEAYERGEVELGATLPPAPDRRPRRAA